MSNLDEAINRMNRGEIKSIAFGNSAAPTTLGIYFCTLNIPWSSANNPSAHGNNLDEVIGACLKMLDLRGSKVQHQEPAVTSAPSAPMVTRAPEAAPSALPPGF